MIRNWTAWYSRLLCRRSDWKLATSVPSWPRSLRPDRGAMCALPSLDTQIACDLAYVRSCVLRGGRLYLNLMADGET